jgi:predicted HicB family RNase H-like nuclease
MEEKKKKRLHVILPEYVHRILKENAAKWGVSVTQLVIQSVMEHVINHKK